MYITHIKEGKRGCGYRKKGGIYFRTDSIGSTCCKLPFELTVCPCCNQGIKPARGFTWINSKIFETEQCTSLSAAACPMCTYDEKIGLIWVGGSYYPTYYKFMEEAQKMGISRRIAQIPRDFKVGETWIALAHRDVILDGVDEDGKSKFKPAIFSMFQPDRIEYVVKGTETSEELERLVKRGLTLVDIEQI